MSCLLKQRASVFGAAVGLSRTVFRDLLMIRHSPVCSAFPSLLTVNVLEKLKKLKNNKNTTIMLH